jgi:hypothetical protein
MLPMRVLSKGVRTGYLLPAAEFEREKMLPPRMLSTRVRTGYLLAGPEFDRKKPYCLGAERKSENRLSGSRCRVCKG